MAAQGAQSVTASLLVSGVEPQFNGRHSCIKPGERLAGSRSHAGQYKAPALLLQVADSFCDIADAMLRLYLEALDMPSNALANILDASPPIPGVAPASLLQASSYNSAQPCMHCALALFCGIGLIRPSLASLVTYYAAGQQGIIAETHTDRSLLTIVWESSPGLEVIHTCVHRQSTGVQCQGSMVQGLHMHAYQF
jgi:hypothetical protein